MSYYLSRTVPLEFDAAVSRSDQWAVRSKNDPHYAYAEPSSDGEVNWMTPIGISGGHESGNVDKGPIVLIWVTLKQLRRANRLKQAAECT